MEAFVRTNEQRAQEFSLLERIVRVEEELKALRELDAVRFEAMEKRFDAMTRRLDRFMIWSLGLTIFATALIITVLK